MLILSRKIGEGIVLDGNVTIRLLHVHGKPAGWGRVRIGIEAPPETKIVRKELLVDENQNPAA